MSVTPSLQEPVLAAPHRKEGYLTGMKTTRHGIAVTMPGYQKKVGKEGEKVG